MFSWRPKGKCQPEQKRLYPRIAWLMTTLFVSSSSFSMSSTAYILRTPFQTSRRLRPTTLIVSSTYMVHSDKEEIVPLDNIDVEQDLAQLGSMDVDESDAWESSPLWEDIKNQAKNALELEPEAGPQLYQGIISQPTLLDALVTLVSHEIETEFMPATAIKNLFLEMLTPEDNLAIHMDVMAVCMRSSSMASSLTAIMFQKGIHALVCYRVGHRLWREGRTGLAFYLQHTVSRYYSADIHPACRMGSGIYLCCGAGVVIGETAIVGQDVSIMQGVTLGGTGKEAGDRHPKVGNGVILHDGATVLGNIKIGDGSIVTAKSIVTKPVPPLARVSGIPAKVQSYRVMTKEALEKVDELEQNLGFQYMQQWQNISDQNSL